MDCKVQDRTNGCHPRSRTKKLKTSEHTDGQNLVIIHWSKEKTIHSSIYILIVQLLCGIFNPVLDITEIIKNK